MACYYPKEAWKVGLTEKGKAKLTFKKPENHWNYEKVKLPCGTCIGCKVEKSRQWAIRCVHEASLHEDNCFLTLTFNEEHMPENRSINKRDLQLFFKRLRKRYPNKVIKYFACGEYGDERNRPHYHVILFNHDFRHVLFIEC